MSLRPPTASLRNRLFVAFFVLAAVFFAGTSGYYILGRTALGEGAWPLGDCAYMTVVTLTTVGYAEILNVGDVPGGRLFTCVVIFSGLGTALYFVSTLTTFLIEGEFQHLRAKRKMKKMIDSLQDHIIVCGGGTHGISIVQELVSTRTPVVVVDHDPGKLERLREIIGVPVPSVVGDATEDTVLLEAGIARARGLMSALPEDRDNLFVVVTARELGPKLRIVAKAEKQKSAEKLRKAGADSCVLSSYIGGVRMVSEMIRPEVVEFLDVMVRDKDKNLRIEEVLLPQGSQLHGKPLSEARIRDKTNLLVLAVRDPQSGQFTYNPGPTFQLAAGMALIVMGETDSVHTLRDAATRGFDPTASFPAVK